MININQWDSWYNSLFSTSNNRGFISNQLHSMATNIPLSLLLKTALSLTGSSEHVQHSLGDYESSSDVDTWYERCQGSEWCVCIIRHVTSAHQQHTSNSSYTGYSVSHRHEGRVQSGGHPPYCVITCYNKKMRRWLDMDNASTEVSTTLSPYRMFVAISFIIRWIGIDRQNETIFG